MAPGPLSLNHVSGMVRSFAARSSDAKGQAPFQRHPPCTAATLTTPARIRACPTAVTWRPAGQGPEHEGLSMAWVRGSGTDSPPPSQPPGAGSSGRTGCECCASFSSDNFIRKTWSYAAQNECHDGPQHGKEHLRNEEQVLKSACGKGRVDAAGLRNDFWNILSNELEKKPLFFSSVHTVKIHWDFSLTSNSQDSNSHN